MTIEDQIKDEKVQYDINREAAKISALSSGKLDKYEYLTGEETLPSNQQQIIQQAKFNYSPIEKALEKQRKAIEDQGEKQVDALKNSYKKLPSIKDNPSIRMYINRTENRITFKIKNGYYLELLTPETMKLLGSTESKITKDKNGENVPHLEVVEFVLVHCNLVNNDYQQDSRILFTFVPNKTFGSLLEISPTNQVFLKTFNSEFQEVKVWFTDQTSKPLELEDKINITLIIK